jgi:Tol biopolymer transport system component
VERFHPRRPFAQISEETDSGVVSPDGTRIAALRGNGKLNASELWLMNSDGSQPRKLLDIAGYSNSLTWSPNGTRLAYMKASYWPGYKEEVQIETIDLATGDTKTTFSDDKIGGGLVWSRDGRLFFSLAEEYSNIKSISGRCVSTSAAEMSGQYRPPDQQPGLEATP